MTIDIAALAARAEITDVLLRYVRAADRNDWDLLRSCYHPDATDDHGLYSGDLEGLIAFLRALAATLNSTSHQLGPPLIEVDIEGITARAETYCLGFYERLRRSNSEPPVAIAQGLRYLDTFELREGRWAIATRVCVLDWERIVAPGKPSQPATTWQRGTRGSNDPSADFFAFVVDATDSGQLGQRRRNT